jgi:PAS domain S-box-containing protein
MAKKSADGKNQPSTQPIWDGECSNILDEIQEGVWVVEAKNYQMVYLNKAAEKLYDRPQKDLLENPNLWRELIIPSERDRLLQCLAKISETGRQEIEYHIQKANGEIRLIKNKLWMVKSEEKNQGRINGIMAEIGDGEANSESSLCQQIASNLPAVIYQYVLHPDGSDEITYISPGAREIYELEPKEILQNQARMWELLPKGDFEPMRESIASSAETLTEWEYQWRIITASGTIKWLSGVSRPQKHANGDLIWDGFVRDISDRKQIEGEKTRLITSLAESEARYRTVLSALSEGIVLQDASGIIRTCNASAEKILGITAEEMMGRTSTDTGWRAIKEDGSPFPGEEHPNSVTLRTGQPCHNVVMGVQKLDGTLTWISVNSQPLFRPNENAPYASVASFTDITERKETETALLESEERFRNLVETTSDWIWSADSNWNYTYVSPQVKQILGYSPEEVLGKTPFDFMPPPEAQRSRQLFQSLTGARQPLANLENLYLHKDGGEVVLETSGRPVFDLDGNFEGYCGIARDIGDRKSLEKELAKREALFNAFFAAAPAGLAIFDEELRFVLINETLAATNNVPVAEHIGKTIREVIPHLAPTLEPAYRKILTTGESMLNFEVSNELPDRPGVQRDWIVSWFPIFGTEPKPIGVGSVVVEISDRKRTEAALQASEARNQAMLSAMPDLLFRLSKDGKILDFKAPNIFDLPLPNHEFIGKNVAEILPEEVANSISNYTQLALATGKMQVFEYQLPLMGDRQECEARVAVVADSEVLAIVRDITDRKQAEIALQESERRFRAVFDSMFQFMALLKPDGTVIESNQTFLDFFGIEHSELVGLAFWQAPRWLPENRVLVKESIHRAAKGDFSRYELDLIGVNNSFITIDFSIKPLKDETDTVVLLIAEGRDISERKQAEMERDRFFTVSLDLLCVAGFDGYFKRLNPSWQQLLGYSERELLSMPFIELVHPEDIAPTLGQFADLTKLGKTVIKFENRYRAKDGSYKWLAWTSVPFLEEGLVYAVARDISDRKAAEEELSTLARNLQAAQRIAHIGNWEYDLATRTITWSDEIKRIYGMDPALPAPTPEEHIRTVHPEDRRLWQRNTRQVLATGQPCDFDFRILRPNGEIGCVNARAEAICDRDGQTMRLFGTVMDVTDRKQAEATLREREQFLRSIYDGVEQVIFVVDACSDGNFRYIGWNLLAEQMTGISAADGWGKTPEEVFGPSLGYQFHQRFADCVAAGTSVRYEERMTFQDSDNWSLTVLTPLRDAGGAIYRIVGTTNNITDRKQAELALQKSEAQFRQLAKREALIDRIGSQIRNSLELDTILETTVREIYNLLEVDVCTFAWYQPDRLCWQVTKEVKKPGSPSFLGEHPAEMLGSLSEELLQMEIYQVDDANMESDPLVREFLVANNIASGIWLSTLTSSGVCAFGCTRGYPPQPWTNEEIQLLDAVSDRLAIAINQAELYQQSRLSALVATAKSQELEQTLRELRRTQSQLIQAEKMSSLGQMVAGIAHEINNPVNFIFGNLNFAGDYLKDILDLLELYQNTYPEPTPEIERAIESIELDFLIEDLQKLFKSMKVGAERIREIVKSLRTFSRLDEAEIKEIDIHENLDSTLLILQNRLKSKPSRPAIEVVKEYGQLPLVECYAGPLNQVFMNIIANAIDALDERDKNRTTEEINAHPSRIAITTVLRENNLEISLVDNGIGMSKKAIDKIFDPFFTTKPIGKGTGLGLSISYQIIVEKHRGELRCISEEGKGTEFIIIIPKKQ